MSDDDIEGGFFRKITFLIITTDAAVQYLAKNKFRALFMDVFPECIMCVYSLKAINHHKF